MSETNNKKRIAVYGLSTETERELPFLLEKYDVVGLLDGVRCDGEIYGQPIISFDTAVENGVTEIIVVARPGSCKAISKKIGKLCKNSGILLSDVRGNDLLEEKKVVFDFKSVIGYTRKELMTQAENVPVVSFDLFDTLVVRDVPEQRDVLELVDARLRERGLTIHHFTEKRIAIEKQLSQGHAPSLEYIYDSLLGTEIDISLPSSELAEIEFKIDLSLLQPRHDMVALLRNFRTAGKKVFITSETYYSEEQIKTILDKTGIEVADNLILSSKYDTGKTSNLYEILVDLAGTRDILHIGDDVVADIEAARRHNIQTFKIYSSSDLFDCVGGLGLMSDEASLTDRIRIGMYAARLFNSPFQFEDENRKIDVRDSYDVGYLFVAPMITDFVKWFGEKIIEYDIKNIWFCARDGYLLQKIFNIFFPDMDSEYFLTSRISAIRAGTEDVSDIEYVDSMKYSGHIQDNLLVRYGIDESELGLNCKDEKCEGLTTYSDTILNLSKQKRENALKYIEKLKIKTGDIAFFDFVAKGTTQIYIQRLIGNNMKGLYFLQLEPDFMQNRNLDIIPFYSEDERNRSSIYENYYILETLLTSPEASLEEFDEEGEPVFAEETRSIGDIDCIMRAQEGIVDYAQRYLAICPKKQMTEINKNIGERMLSLIHNVVISDNYFLALAVEDPFFNRKTDITDIL